MSYLVDKLSPDHSLHPRNLKIRAKVDQFLYFDQGTLTPSNRKIYGPIVFHGDIAPPPEAVVEYKEKLAMLEKHLEGKKFLVTDKHTIADIAIYVTLSQSRLADFDLSEFKAVKTWVDTMKEVLAGEEEIVSTPLAEFKAIAYERRKDLLAEQSKR